MIVCAYQGVWLKRILKELGHSYVDSIIVIWDNNSTIKLFKNPVMRGQNKHFNVSLHLLRNLTKEGIIDLIH